MQREEESRERLERKKKEREDAKLKEEIKWKEVKERNKRESMEDAPTDTPVINPTCGRVCEPGDAYKASSSPPLKSIDGRDNVVDIEYAREFWYNTDREGWESNFRLADVQRNEEFLCMVREWREVATGRITEWRYNVKNKIPDYEKEGMSISQCDKILKSMIGDTLFKEIKSNGRVPMDHMISHYDCSTTDHKNLRNGLSITNKHLGILS